MIKVARLFLYFIRALEVAICVVLSIKYPHIAEGLLESTKSHEGPLKKEQILAEEDR
jgi:hypothetical protein